MTPPIKSRIEFGLFLLLGLAFVSLFLREYQPPLEPVIVCFVILTLWGLFSARADSVSILARLMILLYALPFSVTLGYLFLDDYDWGATPVLSALLSERRLIVQVLSTGIVGLLGLLAGMKIGEIVIHRHPKPARRQGKTKVPGTLTLPLYVLLLGLALFFSYLRAPTETIFSSPYAAEGTSGVYEALNFNAADLISYAIMVLLFIDAERDPPAGRRLKMTLLMSAMLFIVLYLQVSRGDRESIGLIAAFMALYVTGSTRIRHGWRQSAPVWKRIGRLAIPSVLVLVLFIALGSARFHLSGDSSQRYAFTDLLADGFKHNTWTAVLFTNIGLAERYQYGMMDYLLGQTYLDYLLSLPPGILTRPFGYERPLEATSGPNWWFIELSGGGIHPVVVPFMNFGIVGCFLVMTLYGAVIVLCERPNRTLWSRFLYGILIISSFKWFWYGDMNIIRGLMVAAILWLAYAFVAASSRRVLVVG